LERTQIALQQMKAIGAVSGSIEFRLRQPGTRPAFDGVFRSDGREWQPANLEEVGLNLDLSVPLVRKMVFDAFLEASETHFRQSPDELFIFGTDPEDGGGYAELASLLRNPHWYPETLMATDRKFGEAYVLHGMNGLDQPIEIWDPAAPSDTVFGFNNWLLAEYDRWLEGRPATEQVTAWGEQSATRFAAVSTVTTTTMFHRISIWIHESE
jgi:hypothetical protein